MTQAERDIRYKKPMLELAAATGNVSRVRRHFGISRETYNEWKRAFEKSGDEGSINRRPSWAPGMTQRRIPAEIEEKIFHLRRAHRLGPMRIARYLQRYHGTMIGSGTMCYVLRREGTRVLLRSQRTRSIQSFYRCEKQMPGHHVQIDLKFLSLDNPEDRKIQRFQYTAVDGATRIRALRIHRRHTQKNAIDFVDCVVRKFLFRIHTIHTDRGQEFQSQSLWHVEEDGICHAYIKSRVPRPNRKVEGSRGTDEREFYQLIEYKGHVDLGARLQKWEKSCNLHRPHGAHKGKAPYKALKDKLELGSPCQPRV